YRAHDRGREGILLRISCVPSPRRGEGQDEGVRTTEFISQSFAPPHPTPLPSGEREFCVRFDARSSGPLFARVLERHAELVGGAPDYAAGAPGAALLEGQFEGLRQAVG